jgi:hypothetical protein
MNMVKATLSLFLLAHHAMVVWLRVLLTAATDRMVSFMSLLLYCRG